MILRAEDTHAEIHLDFVPMVDVLFNLLIFFLLATTIAQVEREMNIALPFAKAAGPISAALRDVVINVDAEGRIVLAGRTTTAEELDQTIRSAVQNNPSQKVTVRGDRHVPYGVVVRVLDICKHAGVQQPYLDTVME